MYCPKCGLQQIADEMRFCSRCGLPIAGLAEWLASGGGFAGREDEAPLPSVSPRRKGISRGAKLMFISIVLVPIFFGLSILADHPGPLMLPFTIFLAGLSMMLYARLFGDEMPSVKTLPPQQSYKFRATPESNALPPASNNWMNWAGGQKVRTSELAQPPSVTENTTRLLDNE